MFSYRILIVLVLIFRSLIDSVLICVDSVDWSKFTFVFRCWDLLFLPEFVCIFLLM